MIVEAHSPIGHAELIRNRQIADTAERYGVSVPQLSIRHDLELELGLLPLPKATKPEHMRAQQPM